MNVWRDPPSLDADIYPGLSVWDARVSGSITLNDSRLPLWAFVWVAVSHGWEEVEAGWLPTENYGYTAEDLGRFLNDLLEQRGEFGRLLCVLADEERRENDRSDHMAWWQNDHARNRVRKQLERCLAALETGDSDAG